MTCREFADFMLSYFEGELEEPQMTQFARHLERCENCVRYLDQYRRTIAAERAAFASDDREVPDDVPEGLIQAILASRRA